MSYNKPFPLTNYCLQFTNTLYSHPLSFFFRKPYKPQKDDDYFDIVRKPMDLSTIRKKLTNGEYISIKQWEDEIRLIFKNSILYNGETHLLGGISLYFLKKIDKFLENVESSNSRNYEEKTKKLYNDVLKLLREMPAVEIEYINIPSNENVSNNLEQNVENQMNTDNPINTNNQINTNDQINTDNQIQNNETPNQETNQVINEPALNNNTNQIFNNQNQNYFNDKEQIEVIQDIEEIDSSEMYPLSFLNPQGYGQFDKERMRQIKNNLNSLVPNNLNEIIMLIHNSDQDFRCIDPKEIDVASMSRRTLITIEDYVQKAKNNDVSSNNVNNNNIIPTNDDDTNKAASFQSQPSNQFVHVRPANHLNAAENLDSEEQPSVQTDLPITNNISAENNSNVEINPPTVPINNINTNDSVITAESTNTVSIDTNAVNIDTNISENNSTINNNNLDENNNNNNAEIVDTTNNQNEIDDNSTTISISLNNQHDLNNTDAVIANDTASNDKNENEAVENNN